MEKCEYVEDLHLDFLGGEGDKFQFWRDLALITGFIDKYRLFEDEAKF